MAQKMAQKMAQNDTKMAQIDTKKWHKNGTKMAQNGTTMTQKSHKNHKNHKKKSHKKYHKNRTKKSHKKSHKKAQIGVFRSDFFNLERVFKMKRGFLGRKWAEKWGLESENRRKWGVCEFFFVVFLKK
jgi:hypothetical protein